MKASIVVPVYNGEKYLSTCLDSLINQTFDKDQMEVLLVNDGSKDSSLSILKSYESQHSFFKVLDQENTGPAISRSNGVKAATGEFVFILSQDCYAVPNWIEMVVQEFEKNPQVGIVQGEILADREIDYPIYHCTVVSQFSFSFETAGIAYRMSALEKSGKELDPELSEYGDDTDFAWRIIEAGYEAIWLATPTVYHLVLPEAFWRGVKRSWNIQRFALLVKKHPQLRQYFRFGIFWTLHRTITFGLFVLTLLSLVIDWKLTLIFFSLLVLWMIRNVLKGTRNQRISLYEKLFVVLPQSFLNAVIGEAGLIWGSIRFRSIIL